MLDGLSTLLGFNPTSLRFEAAAKSTIGRVLFPDNQAILAACGRAGLIMDSLKREGDGSTPVGEYQFVAGYYRADRLAWLMGREADFPFPLSQIRKDSGWCDDSKAHGLYNQYITLPTPFSHEILWREDGKYDFLLVMDYNYHNPISHKGSAIFLHLAEADWQATAGCIAIGRNHLRGLVNYLTNDNPNQPPRIAISQLVN